MPSVLNKYKAKPSSTSVYIGRPSKWGNPFIIGKDGTRDDVVDKYHEWIMQRPELIALAKKELKGKDLICYCSPNRCHGDVLIEIANS